MNTITKKIIDYGIANRPLRVNQLKRLVKGSSQRRYNLVNRAIKAGELIRFHRGLYMLTDHFRDHPCHPFVFAQALYPGCYVSFETALAYHGWIPEAVFTTACVVRDRKSREFEHEKTGSFTFHPLAVHRHSFLELVNRYQINDQTMLVADPIRALMDLVCLRKMVWKGPEPLLKGFRIDRESFSDIRNKDIRILEKIYKYKRVKDYLHQFYREIKR